MNIGIIPRNRRVFFLHYWWCILGLLVSFASKLNHAVLTCFVTLIFKGIFHTCPDN